MRKGLVVAVAVVVLLAVLAGGGDDKQGPAGAPSGGTAQPEPTAVVSVAVVGNTNGLGAYIRRTPRDDDRLKVWPEGTRMVVLETGIAGGGQTWSRVRDPDGTVGYMPAAYLVPTAAPAPPGRLVATYFYYWYDLPSGPHSTQLTHRPADPETSYRNVGWFKRQLADMMEAGIDIVLAVYWGDAEPSSVPGLVNMARAVNELRAEGRTPPGIAIFVDTGAVGQWPLEQRDLTRPENRERFYGMVRTFYQTLPRDQWALIDGKAVLWMWAAWFDIKFDRAFFDYVREQFQKDFGLGLYIVGDSSWRYPTGPASVPLQQRPPMPLDAYYEWGASLRGFKDLHSGVAQVGPGYDERPLRGPGRTGRYTDRQDGRFYQQQLEQAVASNNRILAIETWNEFHEGSGIAESIEDGRRYIEITRRYAERFKAR